MTKTETVRARVTPAEYTALATLAESQERTTSEIIRELIRAAAKQHGVWPLAVQPAGLPARTRDVRLPGASLQARIAREEVK